MTTFRNSKHIRSIATTTILLCSCLSGMAEQQAGVRIDSGKQYQKITVYGGFVCSATFGYNYMSTAEIKKLWGRDSQAGYNIMRLYIPIGKSAWSASLATAKLAKSMGLIVFASPWSMPSEWKTNNATGAVSTDSNGNTQIGYLKETNYSAYANYLHDYVSYLRSNGVAASLATAPSFRAWALKSPSTARPPRWWALTIWRVPPFPPTICGPARRWSSRVWPPGAP